MQKVVNHDDELAAITVGFCLGPSVPPILMTPIAVSK